MFAAAPVPAAHITMHLWSFGCRLTSVYVFVQFNELGEVIEPFNLREEREVGYFDENQNFIWKREAAEPDAWLANLDEAEMEQVIGEAARSQKVRWSLSRTLR
jgi:hypothetical protein